MEIKQLNKSHDPKSALGLDDEVEVITLAIELLLVL